MSLNRATVIGYLGQDPQLRHTPQGTPVCTLSVATDESYTNKQTGARKEAVEWHRVVVWGKQGSICAEKLAKGRQLYVEGKLSTRSYDKDGEKRYVTEIVACGCNSSGRSPMAAWLNCRRWTTATLRSKFRQDPTKGRSNPALSLHRWA